MRSGAWARGHPAAMRPSCASGWASACRTRCCSTLHSRACSITCRRRGRAGPTSARAACWKGRSKALVARLVGAGAGSATERAYTLRTLPRGVARGLVDTLVRCDPGGLARAGAITLGLAITSAGYLQGMAGQLLARRSQRRAVPQRSGAKIGARCRHEHTTDRACDAPLRAGDRRGRAGGRAAGARAGAARHCRGGDDHRPDSPAADASNSATACWCGASRRWPTTRPTMSRRGWPPGSSATPRASR